MNHDSNIPYLPSNQNRPSHRPHRKKGMKTTTSETRCCWKTSRCTTHTSQGRFLWWYPDKIYGEKDNWSSRIMSTADHESDCPSVVFGSAKQSADVRREALWIRLATARVWEILHTFEGVTGHSLVGNRCGCGCGCGWLVLGTVREDCV